MQTGNLPFWPVAESCRCVQAADLTPDHSLDESAAASEGESMMLATRELPAQAG